MKFSFADIVKKKLSLLIIILLASICCSSFGMTFDAFGPTGSIMGSRNYTASHSLIVCTPAISNKDSGGSIARKSLQITGESILPETVFHFKIYFLSICISTFAYLFLLTHVIYIHLQDGSK